MRRYYKSKSTSDIESLMLNNGITKLDMARNTLCNAVCSDNYIAFSKYFIDTIKELKGMEVKIIADICRELRNDQRNQQRLFQYITNFFKNDDLTVVANRDRIMDAISSSSDTIFIHNLANREEQQNFEMALAANNSVETSLEQPAGTGANSNYKYSL